MDKTYKILVINPGSTSTKVSYFENEKNVYTESVFHDAPVLLSYPTVNDQIPMRRAFIEDFVARHGLKLSQMDAFVGRGGSAYPQVVIRPWTQFFKLDDRPDMPLSRCHNVVLKDIRMDCRNFFDVGTSDKYDSEGKNKLRH